MTNNLLMVIHPYKDHGTWVFDDADKGLSKEALVAGIPEIIEHIVGDSKQFTAVFSGKPFPGYEHQLTWVRPEYDGNVYKHAQTGKEGWLCPALLRYFSEAPGKISIYNSNLSRL